MYRWFIVFIMVEVLAIGTAHGLSVDGYCKRTCESDHFCTHVELTGPFGLEYETHTESSGHYYKNMPTGSPGWWTIVFSHAECRPETLTVWLTLGENDLDTVILKCGISGPQSDYLGSGDICVRGDISVEAGHTLTILPGTRLLFLGHYKFNIYGCLNAIGTPQDSIVFTRYTEYFTADEWWGIRFNKSADDCSRLEYCRIEYGKATGSGTNGYGGGIYIYNSNPTIKFCTISNNWANYGGGIYCRNFSDSIAFCTISENSANCGGGVRCYYSSCTLSNCTITNNSADTRAGGVYCSYYEPVLDSCAIRQNSADDGGGVYCYSSDPTLTNCSIFENLANNDGGGMYCYSSNTKLDSCTIRYNQATSGGGVYYDYSSDSLTNCAISGNRAHSGSGVYCNNSHPNLKGCTISGNQPPPIIPCSSDGAGVYCYLSNPHLDSCLVIGNHACTNGGGIYCDVSDPILTNCTIIDNWVGNNGGGMYCTESSPTIDSCIISNNSADSLGGGIYSYNLFPSIIFCTISGDSAASGGGIYGFNLSDSITSCIISGNSAVNKGGGVCLYQGSPTLTTCIIDRNSANEGGGISCVNSNSKIISCTIYGDSAHSGGGIYCGESSPTIIDNIIVQSPGGAGIFCSAGSVPIVRYNDVGNNIPLDYFGCDPNLGVLDTVNANGDSCDAYFNISLDPLFACHPDTCQMPDFHLLKESHCIDAGDTTDFGLTSSSKDFDGAARVMDGDSIGICTIDIGADEFPGEYCVPPGAIELSSFTTTGHDGYVEVKWTTETEIDNAGFNLHRGLSKDGGYAKINDQLISAMGSALERATYSFTDYHVTNGVTYYYWLEDIDLSGQSTVHGPVSATPGLTSVEEKFKVLIYSLRPAYSVGRNISVAYSTPKNCWVNLSVYDVTGRQVRELVNEIVETGRHEVTWYGEDVPSGIYFCRMSTDEYTATKKMVLVK